MPPLQKTQFPGKRPSRAKRRRVFKHTKRATAPKAVKFSSLQGFMDSKGAIRIARVTAKLRMSKAQLAKTVGLVPASAEKNQIRIREMLEIITRVSDWAGGIEQATAWYRAEPIPALGGRTAESLVKSGEATAVRDYLDAIAVGGYA